MRAGTTETVDQGYYQRIEQVKGVGYTIQMLKAACFQQTRPPNAPTRCTAHNHPANTQREANPTQGEQNNGYHVAQVPFKCRVDADHKNKQAEVP